MPDVSKAFRLYAKYRQMRLAHDDPSARQEKILLHLVKKGSLTRFGREHDFKSITGVTSYQARVPLRKYEDFWNDYWKDAFPKLTDVTWPGTIPYFCLSSGTSTGNTKYIPYTKEMIKSNSKAGTDLLVYHLLNRPQSKLFGGKTFVLGGSTNLVEYAPGILGGDLSGIAAKTLPAWANYFYFPPLELALMENWEEKIDVLAKASLKQDIRSLMGVPSWLLILITKLQHYSGKIDAPLVEIFPNLEMVVHGGVNFSPYRKQFEKLLLGSHAELREVYPASEGFIAVADQGYGEGLRLNYSHGLFYEFIPLNDLNSSSPKRHWLGNIELGLDYAIAVTNPAGMWSYILGDTVKFVSLSPPRILITGRTSYSLSAFGEHLTGSEVELAVSRAANEIGEDVVDYAMGASYPADSSDLGGHILVVEFTGGAVPNQESRRNFEDRFFKELCSANADYEAHFAAGFGLKRPEIIYVGDGIFAAWMKARGKLGGQNKVPRLIPDNQLFGNLLGFVNSRSKS